MNEHDIKARWQQTTEEPLVLTSEALHRRSLAFQRTVWQQDMVELFACGFVALFFGYQIGTAPNALTRLGELLAAASATLAAYQLRRHAARRPTDACIGASLLAFHVRELQRRHDLLRSVWRWIIVPMVVALWVIVAGFVQAKPVAAGPLLTLGCIMSGMGFLLSLANVRKARRLQRDIAALVPLGIHAAN
jgi:hypothetical protein